jgi:hypothetical protein
MKLLLWQLEMQFLSDKNICLVEIHWQIVEAFGEGAVNKGNVRKWQD